MSDIVEALRQASLNQSDYRWEAADEIERLREWNAEIALNARHFAEALREIAEHPTGGIGCNPEGFVKAARAALEGK